MSPDPLSGLDSSQEQAVRLEGHALIIAGPGSGKTRTLAARAVWLLASGAGDLAAVAFTRDSAREIRSRIRSGIGGREGNKRVMAGTFHSLASKQLKNHGVRVRLLDEAGRAHYVLRAREICGDDLPIDEALRLIDGFKATTAPPPADGVGTALFAAYQRLLARDGILDFSDLVLKAVSGMGDGTIQPLPVRWLMVDEAQDLDDAQYAWLRAHVRAGVFITLVGDDDQSIYGWRHALGFHGLERFANELRAARAVLTRNYRCAPEVAEPALRLIRHNPTRFAKPIQPERPAGGDIRVIPATRRIDEAEIIIRNLLAEPGQWAVLARTNRLLDFPELLCGPANLPVRRLGGRSFWERPAASAVCDALLSIQDGSWVGVDRLLGLVGLPPSTLETLRGQTLAEIVAHPPDVLPPNTPHRRAAVSLCGLMPQWRELAHRERTNLLLTALSQWLTNHISGHFVSEIARQACTALARREGSLAARLAGVRANSSRPPREDTPPVILATLHAAKGLEWDRVWILACEEGVVPHIDAPLDEERRLFYVGMTRARHHLTCSFALTEGVRSRFLEEAGLFS